MRHEVYWYGLKQPNPRPLSGTLTVDVVIIGGGMMGLMCALTLHRHGLKVAVLEKDFCGSGATGKSSGFMTPDSELSLSVMLRKYGQEKAKKFWNFAAHGLDTIRETVEEFALPCDYQEEDSLFVANSKSGWSSIVKEHEARERLGYDSVLYTAESMSRVLGTDKYFGGVRYGQTFSFNAYAFVQELKIILEQVGVKIFENSAVTEITRGTVVTAGGQIQADRVIVCTDRCLPQQGIGKRAVGSAQTFLGLSQPLSAQQIGKIFPDGQCMVWDTDLIYQYFRITPDRRLLIGASSLLYTYFPFYKRRSAHVEKKMLKYWHEKFSNVDLKLEYFWPGLIGVSKDFLPIVGVREDGVVFGGGAAGLPWAAAVGMYLADKITRSRSDFDLDFGFQRSPPLGKLISGLLPKPLAFALNQGIVKLL